MSRPVLSSATRRLSLVASSPRPFQTSRSTLNRFSACSDTSLSGCRRFVTRTPRQNVTGTRLCRKNASPLGTVRQRAAFSSSSVRPAAVVVQNEKKDEEGNVLMVDISARAAEVSPGYAFALSLSFWWWLWLLLLSTSAGLAWRGSSVMEWRHGLGYVIGGQSVQTEPGIVPNASLFCHIRP